MFNFAKSKYVLMDTNIDPTDPGSGTSGGTGKSVSEPPESQKQNDGKPSDEVAALTKEVMKKKEALKQAQQKVAELESKMATFDGIDPEQVRQLLEEKKAAELKELERRGEFDQIRKQMIEQHNSELTSLRQQLQSKTSELATELDGYKSQVVELTLGTAFANSQFIRSELVDALTPNKVRSLFGSHFELQGDKIVGYNKPSGAKDRVALVDGNGEPLSFELAIKKIVDADPDRDSMLRSKLKPGAGSSSDPNASGSNPKVASGADRIKAAISQGALKLPQVR